MGPLVQGDAVRSCGPGLGCRGALLAEQLRLRLSRLSVHLQSREKQNSRATLVVDPIGPEVP